MNDQNEKHPYLPNQEIDPNKIRVEIPAQQQPGSREKVYSGYDPIGNIRLEGKAYRGLAAGRMPGWILIFG